MSWALLSINRHLTDVSINNQPIPFPMDRDGHDFHALFQYMGTKLHAYLVIL